MKFLNHFIDLLIIIGLAYLGLEIFSLIKEEYHGWRISWNFAFYTISIVLLIMLTEVYFLGFSKSTLGSLIKNKINHTTKIDFLLFFGILFNFFRPFEILLFFGPYLLRRKIYLHIPFFYLGQYDIPFWQTLKYPTYFFMREFLDYWMHRLQHQVKFLWEFHQLHHSAKDLNVVTLFRVHPGDGLSNYFIRAIPLALLGFQIQEMMIFILFELTVHFLQHSRLESDWGWFGKYVLLSPMAHRLHHAQDKKDYDHNFGSLTPIFDLIFGTWSGKCISLENLGIKNDPYENKSLAIALLRPIKNFYIKLFKWV